jgi:hypothetical protein
MLIIALVLALVGLVALVFAVVTSNELVAWVCIAASVVGVVLLIIDAVQERRRGDTGDTDEAGDDAPVDYPEEVAEDEPATEAETPKTLENGETEESAVSAEGRRDDHA